MISGRHQRFINQHNECQKSFFTGEMRRVPGAGLAKSIVQAHSHSITKTEYKNLVSPQPNCFKKKSLVQGSKERSVLPGSYQKIKQNCTSKNCDSYLKRITETLSYFQNELHDCFVPTYLQQNLRTWPDTCFHYKIVPDREILEEETYSLHLPVTVTGYLLSTKKNLITIILGRSNIYEQADRLGTICHKQVLLSHFKEEETN